jgi:hypothetical protein
MKIKGRAVRVWQIPSFDNVDIDIDPPEFGSQHEAPF